MIDVIDFQSLNAEFRHGTPERAIHRKLHLSRNTVRRYHELWGYVDGANQTRQSTLDVLSLYVGYRDWNDYLHHLSLQSEGGSHTFIAPGVHTADLCANDRVEVSWLPNRHCIFRYLGDGQFEVELAENSKLHQGDTFFTAFMLEGYPMYAHHLIQNNQSPVYYVAGQQGGLVHVQKL